jgi:uncharacterized protein VirK/YbjX
MHALLTNSITTTVDAVEDHLCWAPMREVIGDKRMSKQLEKLKYGVRYYLSRDVRTKFLLKVANSHFGRTLFESSPTNFYVPLRSYLDNRFTVKERFDACIKDVEAAKSKFGELHSGHLLLGGSITLMRIGNFSVDLQMNRVSRHEGFWALSVKDESDKPISNLSFGFLDGSTLLIASVQGMKDSSRNILELNKKLTKDSFGFRPQNLLIATIQSLCEVWNIENLIGIDPKNQVKRRINTERQGFKFDYTGFWNELGASKNFSGYWNLSNETPIRNLSDIPSHKRSQYKKRNALLEKISLSTQKIFKQHPQCL